MEGQANPHEMEYPRYCQESDEWIDLTPPQAENYNGACVMSEEWERVEGGDDRLVHVCDFCFKKFY
jgi:hypothetical protein